MAKGRGAIRVGIGGWTYGPWRGTFYPEGLVQKRELEYAASRLGAIEINGTYYRLQKPASFAKWRDETPDDFVFTVKASRYCTNRRVLSEGGEGIENFLNQGLVELGDKLGPILWQFMATKKFDAEDFGSFLELLPKEWKGARLRHALEVRHESFACAEFVEMARKAGAAIVIADDDEHPQIADLTADFVYARLMRSREEEESGYPAGELDEWARIATGWAEGRAPEGLNYVVEKTKPADGRDVFAFMINGAKVRAPVAAEALIERIA